jgi:RHS repeat-associated protein
VELFYDRFCESSSYCYIAGNDCGGNNPAVTCTPDFESCETVVAGGQCNPDIPDCEYEICGNGLDDDCDGAVDEGADCEPEIDCCDSGNLNDPACFDLREQCWNQVDDDCDGLVDEGACDIGPSPPDGPNGPDPLPDPPPAPPDPAEPGGCGDDETDGRPVNLLDRSMYLSPFEDSRIASPQGGSADLVFARRYSSNQMMSDNEDPTNIVRTPYGRTLPHGWRSSYDLRLVLEAGVVAQATNSSIAAPHGITLEAHDHYEQFHQSLPPYPASAPGSNRYSSTTTTYDAEPDSSATIVLTNNATAATLTNPDGDVITFEAGPNNTANTLYPFSKTTFLRPGLSEVRVLRPTFIIPRGVSGYRIAFVYEATGACTTIAGGCNANRSLLAEVRAEWLDGAVWRPGSSHVLQYEANPVAALASTSSGVRLVKVVEGADGAVATATALANYSYFTGGQLQHVWSCKGRTAAGLDSSAICASTELGSRLVSYEIDVLHQFLIKDVLHMVPGLPGTIIAAVEHFDWEDAGFATFFPSVSVHLSPQVELSAPAQVRSRISGWKKQSWTRNGELMNVGFHNGRGTYRERKVGAGVPTATIRKKPNGPRLVGIDIGRKDDGSRQTSDVDNLTTLREYNVDGTVAAEIDVALPLGAELAPAAADFYNPGTGVIQLNAAVTNVTEVRSARVYYYTSQLPSRLQAVATLSNTHQPALTTPFAPAAARRFPITLPASWTATTVTGRAVPTNVVSLNGAKWYFDVSVSDAGDATTTLNGVNQRDIVWSHQTDTGVGGVLLYSSSKSVVDATGRVRAVESFTAPRTGGAMQRTAVTIHTYEPTLAATDRHAMGRLKQTHVFPTVTNTVPAISTTMTLAPTTGIATATTENCGTAAVVDEYDYDGRRVCTTNATAMFTRSLTTSPTTGARLITTTHGVGPSTTVEQLMTGTVIRTATVGGNASVMKYDASSPTRFGQLVQVDTTDNTGQGLTRSQTDYSALGFVSEQRMYEFNPGTTVTVLKRKTTMTHDDRGLLLNETRFVDMANLALTNVTSYTYDNASGRLLSMTEGDGDVVVTEYGTGRSVGQVVRIKRGETAATATTVLENVYDGMGRKTAVWNGAVNSEQAAAYTYEGNRVFEETVSGAGVKRRTFSSVASNKRVSDLVTLTTAKVEQRHTQTEIDGMGRTTRVCGGGVGTCGSAGVSTLESYFYDGKTAAALGSLGPFTVEGNALLSTAARTITLTNNNQLGRLSYVTHPAGTTFYEYDARGRVTMMVQYEGALPLVAASSGVNMKVFEYTYGDTAGGLTRTRYPSGRTVYQTWGADKRGPNEVYIATGTDGGSTQADTSDARIMSLPKYDVGGALSEWTWGRFSPVYAGTDRVKHFVERDAVGRVKLIREEVNNVNTSSLSYNNYDGDGDVASMSDTGPRSVLDSDLLSQTVNFTYDPSRDLIVEARQRLFAPAPFRVTTTTYTASAKRLVRDGITGAYNHSYGAAPVVEQLLGRAVTSGANNDAVSLAYSSIGDATAVTPSPSGVATALTYGARGDLNGYADSVPRTWAIGTDNNRRRWYRRVGSAAAPTQLEAYRYGADGSLADLRRSSGATWSRDEYVYLQGMPIGIVHTDNLNTAPNVYWMSPDAMGTPRRVLERTLTMTQHRRLVMDAWGSAGLYPSTNILESATTPSTTTINVWLPHRLPGQLQGPGEPIVENRYRYYVPTLGQYLTPDPMHQASVMVPGPQAYAYAGGRPLVMSDPLGMRPVVDRYGSAIDAARTALNEQVHRSTISGTEVSGLIYQWPDETGCRYTNVIQAGLAAAAPGPEDLYNDNYFGFRSSLTRRAGCDEIRPKILAWFHTHGDFSGEWYRFSRQDLNISIVGVENHSVDAYLGTPSGSFLYYSPGGSPTRLTPDLAGGLTPPAPPPPGYWQ